MNNSLRVEARRASTASVVRAALDEVDSFPRGAGDLTLAAVAKRVGIATPSIYKHVSSLADLRRRVAVVCVGELTEHVTSAVVGRSGDAALVALVRGVRAFALTYPGRYAAIQLAADRADAADEELALASDRLVRLIGASLAAYDLSGDALIDAVRVIRAAVHGFVALELGGGFGLPQSVDQSFEVLVTTLVNGMGAFSGQAGRSSESGGEAW